MNCEGGMAYLLERVNVGGLTCPWPLLAQVDIDICMHVKPQDTHIYIYMYTSKVYSSI